MMSTRTATWLALCTWTFCLASPRDVVPTARAQHVGTIVSADRSGSPAVTATRQANGVTRIAITPRGGGEVVYEVDLSKHHAPAKQRTAAVKKWEAYKLGAFVCFNTNQFTGKEICTAEDPALYAPAELDVAGWVAVFKKARMRYAVLTVRHTSGFLLWDSSTTDFDVAQSGNKTDVVDEFVGQCNRKGIAPGIYCCMWGGPKWRPDANARAMILAQLHELTTRYGKIPVFWIDMMNWAPADLTAQLVYDALKSRQPDCMVLMNQHIQDGREIRYFPTDVLNGEITLPPSEGHQPFREVKGKRYYLPFEFEPVSQAFEARSVANTPLGPGCWFTYGAGKGFPPSRPFPVEALSDWIEQAYRRGTSNVLLAAAPDHTGRMRPEDAEQLIRLGESLSEHLNP
ncbi:MAG: alpha-L-fucosidase [Planctomycetota bacterium]|jgi:alpha-L-fucosidase